MANPNPNPNAAELQKLMDEMKEAKLLKPSDWISNHSMYDPLKYGGMGKSLPGAQSNNIAGQQANSNKFTHNAMEAMICSRMGWSGINQSPFRDMRCARLNSDEAVVFIIHKETPLMIRDDLHLFPSDALVSQLRLLLA